MSAPTPHYNARTVTSPERARRRARPEPGGAAEPDPGDQQPPAAVIDLAFERLKRHTPGTPYRADEIAPLLTDSGRRLAPGIAEAMNMLIDGRPGDQP